MAAIVCPYCGVHAQLQPLQTWIRRLVGEPEREWAAWHCTICGGGIVGIVGVDPIDGGKAPLPGHYHPRSVVVPDRGKGVPESIADDAGEAHICLQVGSYRAAAVMARRAIQATALDKGAPSNKDLFGQIDWLVKEQVIVPVLQRVAHKVRLGGNVGAHPDKDGLADMDGQEARRLVAFLDEFLRFVYVIPAELEDVEADHDDPPATSPDSTS